MLLLHLPCFNRNVAHLWRHHYVGSILKCFLFIFKYSRYLMSWLWIPPPFPFPNHYFSTLLLKGNKAKWNKYKALLPASNRSCSPLMGCHHQPLWCCPSLIIISGNGSKISLNYQWPSPSSWFSTSCTVISQILDLSCPTSQWCSLT